MRISGHATSISLENAFWEALVALAREAKTPLAQLIERIDTDRGSNLSSAIRVFVLERYRSETGVPPDLKEG